MMKRIYHEEMPLYLSTLAIIVILTGCALTVQRTETTIATTTVETTNIETTTLTTTETTTTESLSSEFVLLYAG